MSPSTPLRVALLGLDEMLCEALASCAALDARPIRVDPLDEPALDDALTGFDAVVVDPVGPVGPVADVPALLRRATLGTWRLLQAAAGRPVVQISTMRLMDAHDPGWAVDERFAPRPADDAHQLAHHLAELTGRELLRDLDGQVAVLRIDEPTRAEIPGATQVHVDDIVAAVLRGLEPGGAPFWMGRWFAVHVVHGQGRYPLGWAAREPFAWQPTHPGEAVGERHRPWLEADEKLRLPIPADDAPVVVLGSGGPLGEAVANELDDRPLVLVDRSEVEAAAARGEQSPGAPVPRRRGLPHRHVVADITDLAALREAVRGAGAIVNTAVARQDVAAAFEVNLIGAWTMVEAARLEGVERLVLCGPAQQLRAHPIGGFDDVDLTSEAPARPGGYPYFLTKFLGQELCRVLAAHRGIACPVLQFDILGNAEVPWPGQRAAMMVSWRDAARAVRAGLEVGELSSAAPVVHVCVPGPHGRFTADRAQQVLGWRPVDDMQHQWWHPESRVNQ